MVSVSEMNFQKIWEAHRDEFCALVQIPSVYDASTVSAGAPYGRPVRNALDYMEELCRREGFQIRDYEGAVFSASWGSGKRVDIVSHLDVVSVSDGWDEPPFSGSVHDGYVHGRGTQDMKAGAYLTFLALKLVKDSGIVPKREIRLVYGSDEERTMEDMRLYVRHAGLPDFAFTPDGMFPMVTGEKGALMWTIEGSYKGFVRSLSGGIQPNVISPYAEAEISFSDRAAAEAAVKRLGIPAQISEAAEGLKICVTGKAAHASKPEEGHNATVDLLHLLSALSGEELLTKLSGFFRDPHGEGAGIAYDIRPMGKLSLNLGLLKIENGKLSAMVDCRYPYGVSSKTLTDITAGAFPELRVALPYDDPPTLTPESDPYISVLKEAYREVTGRECTTGISGGVSYSKVFGHSVTFGVVSENAESLAHQKNEKIAEADCISALEIYTRAIKKLTEVE